MTVDGLCDLCGSRQPVRAALVAWVAPVFGPYENVDRCVDVEACKARVFESGAPWPIRERTEARR